MPHKVRHMPHLLKLGKTQLRAPRGVAYAPPPLNLKKITTALQGDAYASPLKT